MAFGTGFYTYQARIPRAWPLLQLPSDLLRYPPFAYTSMAIGAALLASAVGWALWRRTEAPLLQVAPAAALLAVWILCGYASFLATIPAVSFAPGRLNLIYWGPAGLSLNYLCGDCPNDPAALGRRGSCAHDSPGAVLCDGAFAGLPAAPRGEGWTHYSDVIEQLSAIGFNDLTKFYASPNYHLIWTFYTRLQVQSMGPIRPEYLNSYPGDIIYIDSFFPDTNVLSADRISEAARRSGCILSKGSAEEWSRLLLTRDYRESMLRDIAARPETQLERIPGFSEGLLNASRERARKAFGTGGLELITRGVGFEVRGWRDWRNALFYRFAGNAAFGGNAPMNYAERLRGSDTVEDSGFAI